MIEGVLIGEDRKVALMGSKANFPRLLPEIECPLCKGKLKESRVMLYGQVFLSWVCDCWGFRELQRSAASYGCSGVKV